MVLLLLWIDWYSTQPINAHTHQKCRKYIYLCVRVFSVSSTRIFSALLCQAPSLWYLISGVTRHALPSLPPYRARAFVLIARKKKCSELSFLLWRPLASNWCAFIQPTRIVRSTQAAKHFLRSVSILILLFLKQKYQYRN